MEPEKKNEHQVVQTYAEDMAQVISDDTEGLVKKIIHGEEEHEAEKEKLSPESKQNKIFMLVGIVLVVIAGAILAFFFLRTPDNSIPAQEQFTPLIFNDKTTFLEVVGLAKTQIIQSVLNQVKGSEVKVGGLEGIYLTENKKIIGLRRFISLLGFTFTPDPNTLLISDSFLMGAVDKEFFLLLQMRSTPDIFDSLRAWEEKMFLDLHTVLGVSLSNETKYLFLKPFEDSIVENKNARVVYDKDGNIALLYIFADDNSVIITNSELAAHEVMLRLTSSQKKQ